MIRYILTILTFSLVLSCEDVIDVDVPTAEPNLVIEASLDWEKGTSGNQQIIKLSWSTPFFQTDQNTAVTGAIVSVTNNDTEDVFPFVDQNNGTYTTNNFLPILNNSYTLNIEYDGQTFKATETLMPVSDINAVTLD